MDLAMMKAMPIAMRKIKTYAFNNVIKKAVPVSVPSAPSGKSSESSIYPDCDPFLWIDTNPTSLALAADPSSKWVPDK